MADIILDQPRVIPILLSLPFQLSIISLGLFFLIAFGSGVITANSLLAFVALKVSLFDLFIGLLIFAILMILSM